MTTWPVLDVAIGMSFLYLLFALSCTTVNELIAGFSSRRAKVLRDGIEHLLGDKGLAADLYQHPSIQSLAKPDKKLGATPSYIPSDRFAAALTDHITGTASLSDQAALDAGIKNLPADLSRQLRVLFDVAKGDPDEFRKCVASWYDETMDRVSGWYKRIVQRQTYVIAILFVLVLNLDSVQLFNRLWSDSAFRTAAVEQAKARIEATGTAEVPVMEYTEGNSPNAGSPVQIGSVSLTDSEKQLLTSLAGWQFDRQRLAADVVIKGGGFRVREVWLARVIVSHFLGWIVTVLAISLGAPFWFDVLNKFMNVRNAGRATDEPRSKA